MPATALWISYNKVSQVRLPNWPRPPSNGIRAGPKHAPITLGGILMGHFGSLKPQRVTLIAPAVAQEPLHEHPLLVRTWPTARHSTAKLMCVAWRHTTITTLLAGLERRIPHARLVTERVDRIVHDTSGHRRSWPPSNAAALRTLCSLRCSTPRPGRRLPSNPAKVDLPRLPARSHQYFSHKQVASLVDE